MAKAKAKQKILANNLMIFIHYRNIHISLYIIYDL